MPVVWIKLAAKTLQFESPVRPTSFPPRMDRFALKPNLAIRLRLSHCHLPATCQRRLWLGPIAMLLIVASVGCQPSGDDTAGAESKRSDAPVAVQLVSVQQATTRQTSRQPATVHPFYEAALRPRVQGFVREVRSDIGDVVKAGDVLIVLDVPDLEQDREAQRARIARLEAEVQRANAGAELARAVVQSAEANVAAAQSEMAGAEAELVAAESEFARTQDLVSRQSLQQRMLDEALQRRDSRRAALDAIRSSVNAAQAEVTVAQAKLTAAAADVDAAKADVDVALRQLDRIEVMLNFATIKAPFDGIITQRNVAPGDLVDAIAGPPLLRISQVDRVRVHVPVPESDAAHVNAGDAIEVAFPFFPDESPMQGTVTRVAGELDPSTRTMVVEAVLDNADGKLVPGMFGQATIELAVHENVATLPARAIRFDESGDAYVYVVNDQTVSVQNIQTGNDDGSTIEVLSNLPAGTNVIDAHLQRFTDGQQVAVLAP
ncbi:Efflux pump periplasmic linker BepF [Crateriforma conspicua]|nr:Efflux pump periplasmic linker BepF [Crateriforma conspicua]